MQISHLSVSHKKDLRPLIEDLSFVLREGDRCAVIGEEGNGKSTLLNRLTGAESYVQDQLFATLDPTARELRLPDGQKAVIIDTVGLIDRLPHDLVEAFHSTLETAAEAGQRLATSYMPLACRSLSEMSSRTVMPSS